MKHTNRGGRTYRQTDGGMDGQTDGRTHRGTYRGGDHLKYPLEYFLAIPYHQLFKQIHWLGKTLIWFKFSQCYDVLLQGLGMQNIVSNTRTFSMIYFL